MKRIHQICMVTTMAIFSMATAISCPFNFHNDSGKRVKIKTSRKTYFVEGKKTKKIEHGHKSDIYVYLKRRRKPYVLKYTITEKHCSEDVPTIKYSELQKGKQIERFW
jgi:hypothetical protein